MKIENKYFVYKHTSPSGKVYIGITRQKRVYRRWSNGYGYKKGTLIRNAINKYGWENIKHEILLTDQPEKAAKYAEKYLIRWYKMHKTSYN